jgi:hypothetical protein
MHPTGCVLDQSSDAQIVAVLFDQNLCSFMHFIARLKGVNFLMW